MEFLSIYRRKNAHKFSVRRREEAPEEFPGIKAVS